MNTNVLHILIKAYITTSYCGVHVTMQLQQSTVNGIHSPFYYHIVIFRIINEKKIDWIEKSCFLMISQRQNKLYFYERLRRRVYVISDNNKTQNMLA